MAGPSQNQIKFKAVLTQIFGENLNKEFKLVGRQVLIGRSPKCLITISSPGVSRRHCALTKTDNGWSVKDCKSQNGTYINGRQLRQDEEYLLQCGDILFLGPPSELPQAFSYEELMGNDSDDDILELPTQKFVFKEGIKVSFMKRARNIPISPNSKTLKRPSSPSSVPVISDSPTKILPSAPKKYRQQKSAPEERIKVSFMKRASNIPNSPTSKTLNRQSSPSSVTVISDSPTKIEPSAPKKCKRVRITFTPSESPTAAGAISLLPNSAESSESKNNSAEMNIDNVEQFYEISSTNNDECEDSESLIHTDLTDNLDNKVEVKDENAEKADKEKELELQLALLSEQVKTLQASKLELLKNYKNVCNKNKELDKELVEKQKQMEKELEVYEVKAKNEVKSEILEKFEEDLVCNICTELFIKPTVLDCSHTFCEFCIKEWRKKKNDCPICRCKIKNTTQVRTLEQFIDKTLATLTPDQKLKRANVIAERDLKERPPVPPDPRLTPRRRRGSRRHHNLRHLRTNSNPGNSSIQVLHESGIPDYSHTIYRLAPGGPSTTPNPLNFVDLATMGISVIFS